MTDVEYEKISRALEVTREALLRQGMTFNEVDQHIRSLVNLADRRQAPGLAKSEPTRSSRSTAVGK